MGGALIREGNAVDSSAGWPDCKLAEASGPEMATGEDALPACTPCRPEQAAPATLQGAQC